MIVDAAGNVYAGGDIDAGLPDCKGLVKWNGSSWSEFPSYPADVTSVEGLALDPAGYLHASFRQNDPSVGSQGLIAKWNGSAWIATTDDYEKLSVYAWSIVFDATGNLYAGGEFTSNGDGTVPLKYVAQRASGSADWTALGSGFDDEVNALVRDAKGNIYAGGEFASDSTNAKTLNHVAMWNGTEWTALGSGLDEEVLALAIDSEGILYAGGFFTNGVAKWNGTSWGTVGGGVYGYVSALACDTDGSLYVGGMFTKAGDVTATNIAKWSKR